MDTLGDFQILEYFYLHILCLWALTSYLLQYAAREAEIVAQAGRKYAITLSTNMAGRGTDIILGGNPKVDLTFDVPIHGVACNRFWR